MPQRTIAPAPAADILTIIPPLLDRNFDAQDSDVGLLLGRSRGRVVPKAWSDQPTES